MALGFEVRARMNCAAGIIRAAPSVLRHSWSRSQIPDLVALLSCALIFDQATTSTIYLERVDAAAQTRRRDIDLAIAELDGTVCHVISAIKHASGRLIGASSVMQTKRPSAMPQPLRRRRCICAELILTVTATKNLSESIEKLNNKPSPIGHGVRSARAELRGLPMFGGRSCVLNHC